MLATPPSGSWLFGRANNLKCNKTVMEKNTQGYAEAIAEIEQILESFNSEQVDIDSLAAQVKRATELIAMCREKLRKAEEEVATVLREEPGETA